jgi:beta-glucanase (GH16 family)
VFEKNVSEIKLNLGSWCTKSKDGKGTVDINGKKFDISGISNDVTLPDLDTNTIIIASSEKDYRFFLRGIEVMYK